MARLSPGTISSVQRDLVASLTRLPDVQLSRSPIVWVPTPTYVRQAPTISDLPPEVLLRAFCWLDAAELLAASTVSKGWRDLARDKAAWRVPDFIPRTCLRWCDNSIRRKVAVNFALTSMLHPQSSIAPTSFTEGTPNEVAASCPHVRHLDLEISEEDDTVPGPGSAALAWLAAFAQHPVSQLTISRRVLPYLLTSLSSFPRLVALSMNGFAAIGEEQFARIAAAYPQLRKLHMDLQPASLPCLARLTGLEELSMSSTRITDDDLAGTRLAFPRMYRLSMNFCSRVHGPGIAAMVLPLLRVLEVRHSGMTNEGLAAVAGQHFLLTEIDLPESIDGAGLRALFHHCHDLRRVRGTRVLTRESELVDLAGTVPASLRNLILARGRLGREPIAAFKNACPNVDVEFLNKAY